MTTLEKEIIFLVIPLGIYNITQRLTIATLMDRIEILSLTVKGMAKKLKEIETRRDENGK